MELLLVTSSLSEDVDDDLDPVCRAVEDAGHRWRTAHWDDPEVDWSMSDAVVIRSPWDYSTRYGDFLTWMRRVEACNVLVNPAPLLRWNTDKRYLADLAEMGLPVVPTAFVAPGAAIDPDHLPGVDDGWAGDEIVVKPTVSAGSRETARHPIDRLDRAADHVERLHLAGCEAMIQPYLGAVDEVGETALFYYRNRFSHAIRKGPMLVAGGTARDTPDMGEVVVARVPGDDELEVGGRLVDLVAGSPVVAGSGCSALPYARVDLLRDHRGSPVVLELECAEPSMFFVTHPDGAATYVESIVESIVELRG